VADLLRTRYALGRPLARMRTGLRTADPLDPAAQNLARGCGPGGRRLPRRDAHDRARRDGGHVWVHGCEPGSDWVSCGYRRGPQRTRDSRPDSETALLARAHLVQPLYLATPHREPRRGARLADRYQLADHRDRVLSVHRKA